mgnify:FL=1
MSNIVNIGLEKISPYRVMKFTNGDEVICELKHTEGNRFKISQPFKLVTVTVADKNGSVEENLALRKWTSFTDDKVFMIDRQQVVVHYGASVGLAKYYEYVLRKYKAAGDDIARTVDLEKEVREYKVEAKTEDSPQQEEDEEILDEFANVYYDSKTKH